MEGWCKSAAADANAATCAGVEPTRARIQADANAATDADAATAAATEPGRANIRSGHGIHASRTDAKCTPKAPDSRTATWRLVCASKTARFAYPAWHIL